MSTNIPLSVLKQNQPIAKTTVTFSESKKEVSVTIPKEAFQGVVTIEDKALTYDNQYFFSVAAPQLIKVMSIGASEKSSFLERIYTNDQFKIKYLKINLYVRKITFILTCNFISFFF